MKKIKRMGATLLSRLFDPVWEIPAAILLAVSFALQEGIRWRFLGLLLFVDAVVPMVFFLMMLKNKQIKDWDLQHRAQRIPLYLFTLICHMGGLWLTHELGKAGLFPILLIFYIEAVVFFLITLKWKISLHAGVNAVLFTAINVFYGLQYAWLYGFLLLVMWARVYQKHHTWGQVIAGALIGGGIIGLGLTNI
jgi:membrane-associated phospholipid phosphatase